MTGAVAYQHVSVLLAEALEALAIHPSGCYVDGTFGRGGHSLAILRSLDHMGRLLAFDKDPEAVVAGHKLAVEDARFEIVHASFADLTQTLGARGLIGQVQGVLLDLGVSSPQLDDSMRGFSFTQDGPLDMRMNPTQGVSAAHWVHAASEAELVQVFQDYGQERFARRMARAVVQRRQVQPFERTADLAKVLADANPAWEKGKHPATRAFQALRIQVNNELQEIQSGLEAALELLAVGGRLVVISFHSLEDRLVKHFFRAQAKGVVQTLPRYLPIPPSVFVPRLKTLGKPVFAGVAELAANPRARSAVLRAVEKLR